MGSQRTPKSHFSTSLPRNKTISFFKLPSDLNEMLSPKNEVGANIHGASWGSLEMVALLKVEMMESMKATAMVLLKV